MPTIPTPLPSVRTTGFAAEVGGTGKDTISIVSQAPDAESVVLVQATFDGNATKLRLGQIIGQTLATPVYRNALGHAVIEDPNGNELNGPWVTFS